MDCFWCEVVNGQLELKEHEAARWVTGEQIEEVDWLPADLTILESVRRGL
jgi:8-oxo-dGTP diphosphatase